jgi:ATP-dependent DNA ligase
MDHQTIRKRTEPAFIEPMQCKPVTTLPTDERLMFEIKFDGYRCIPLKRGREVTLFSRNKKVLNKRFPKVVDVIASLAGDFVLDEELVAIDSQGSSSFLASAKQSVAGASSLFLRLRSAKPKWGAAGRLAH